MTSMTTMALRSALALAVLLPAATAVAQREGYSYLSWVGPEVTLVSTAEDDSSARPNTPILAGDRLATGPSSRAEAILADGNILRVDVQSSLRFDRLSKTYEAEDDRNAVTLERGAVVLEHRWSTTREQATRIDTDDATVLFPDKGFLRVETGRRGTEVYVVSGRAEVHARSGKATLRAGQYVFVSGDAALEVDWVDQPRDQFTRFVEERRDLAGGNAGSQFVSADYSYDYAAGGFEENGSWVSVGGSYCWRPNVAVGWRPYVNGYWRWAPCGLTWVSYEPWGWLPYHYGSWFWDAGFGWCWSPGTCYSPAWVYWSYTPSWVGWCPIGYYGGYYGGTYGGHHGGYNGGHYGPAYRSRQNPYSMERGTLAYPHLRGNVDVTRVDPRGWSYASVTRLGTRFDARRDVLGHESVGFRPGERGLVATAPLRIDRGRGGPVTTVVQDAVRRIPLTSGTEARGGSRGSDDLTPILRREGTLGASTQEVLRRSYVTPGQDPGYRPVPADQIAAPRQGGSGGPTADLPSRGSGERGLGASSSPARGADASVPGRGPGVGTATREPWRDGGVTGETRGTGGATAPRRDVEAPLGGGFGRGKDVRGDDGWRSPGSDPGSGSTGTRTYVVPSRKAAPGTESTESPARTGARQAAPDVEPWRSTASPSTRRDTPPAPEAGSSPSPGREAPAPRSDEGRRGGDSPSRGSRPAEAPPAPRAEPPARSSETPSRSYEPPARSYEAPRSAPAPRSEAPPSRSYEAPRSAPAPRSEAPPSRSYEAPRSAPAPRSEAPPSRSYSAPSSPPPSRSGDAPQRSASPRG